MQHIGLLVTNKLGAVALFPLITRIHEGLKWNNRDNSTLPIKLAEMSLQITNELGCKAFMVADAFYGLTELASHLKGGIST